ncbi:MAG: DUF3159 domain-containing protein, partial [Kineosporiaceae bacterium]
MSQPTLLDLLGGRRSALDATVPTAAFVVVLIATRGTEPGLQLRAALAAGVVTAVVTAIWRTVRGQQPRAAVVGLLPVLGGAVIAARTGRPEDFFILRILANAASALAWTGSIWIGRPLLGVISGAALRQRGRWRGDPHLYTGYRRGSWWWAASFWLRAAVFAALWVAELPVLLGLAQVGMSWPLMTAVLLLSWRALRLALPPE